MAGWKGGGCGGGIDGKEWGKGKEADRSAEEKGRKEKGRKRK